MYECSVYMHVRAAHACLLIPWNWGNMVVSYHVVTRNQTWVFYKKNKNS